MQAEVNAIFEVDIKKASHKEIDFIEKAKKSFADDSVVEYKGNHWIVKTIEYNITTDGNYCRIFMVPINGKPKVEHGELAEKGIHPYL